MTSKAIFNNDCISEMKKMIDEGIKVDSIVTDPPYELGFMGKKWDSSGIAYNSETWNLCLDLLKSGGHLLSFGGSRTYHRMAVAIEDGGFEIRDQIMWLYGSGFPKSLNIGKSVDKKQDNNRTEIKVTKGNSEYEGWGTGLKPAHEPIVLARKPISEKTITDNVLKHGTGGINIDGCRVGLSEGDDIRLGGKGTWKTDKMAKKVYVGGYNGTDTRSSELGRFPANVMHDGSDVIVNEFPYTKSGKMKQHIEGGQYNVYGKMYPRDVETIGDEGSAARFFYCPKASKKERNFGLIDLEDKQYSFDGRKKEIENPFQRNKSVAKNNHPTVKPIKLMQYLCRLITPKGGTVLDPFMGSGTTGLACKNEGFDFIGIEKEKEYFEIAKARLQNE
jgi:DNA modification methylase